MYTYPHPEGEGGGSELALFHDPLVGYLCYSWEATCPLRRVPLNMKMAKTAIFTGKCITLLYLWQDTAHRYHTR